MTSAVSRLVGLVLSMLNTQLSSSKSKKTSTGNHIRLVYIDIDFKISIAKAALEIQMSLCQSVIEFLVTKDKSAHKA